MAGREGTRVRQRRVGAWRLFPALVGLLALQLPLAGCAGSERSSTVRVRIHYSRFVPAVVTVPRGKPITFVFDNDDPIDHEWIVGTEPVHRAHRTGSEPVHESRASEVTVPALSSRSTTITFAERGMLAFICHLPGHEAYGMVGTLNVS